MGIWLKFMCFTFLASVSLRANADDPPTHIYAPDWGLTLQEDGSGFYNDLARFLLDTDEVGAVVYEIMPYRRTNRTFFADLGSCMYPTNFDFLISGGQLVSKEGYISGRPLIANSIRVFSPHGTTPPAAKSDVAGKSIAYAMGAGTPQLFKGIPAFWIAVADEVDKGRMLLNNRVDILTAALPDAEFVFRELGTDLPPYDPNLNLDDSPVYFACHDTPSNKTFLGRLDARIERLTNSGELAGFLLGHGLDPAVYLMP